MMTSGLNLHRGGSLPAAADQAGPSRAIHAVLGERRHPFDPARGVRSCSRSTRLRSREAQGSGNGRRQPVSSADLPEGGEATSSEVAGPASRCATTHFTARRSAFGRPIDTALFQHPCDVVPSGRLHAIAVSCVCTMVIFASISGRRSRILELPAACPSPWRPSSQPSFAPKSTRARAEQRH